MRGDGRVSAYGIAFAVTTSARAPLQRLGGKGWLVGAALCTLWLGPDDLVLPRALNRGEAKRQLGLAAAPWSHCLVLPESGALQPPSLLSCGVLQEAGPWGWWCPPCLGSHPSSWEGFPGDGCVLPCWMGLPEKLVLFFGCISDHVGDGAFTLWSCAKTLHRLDPCTTRLV